MRLLASLVAVLLMNAAIVVALRVGGGRRTETAWSHTRQFARGVQGADSWKPIEAARADSATARGGLYERVFFRHGVKFQYPPTSLLLADGLDRRELNAISWIATAITVLVSVWIFRAAVTHDWPGGWPPDLASSAACAIAAAALAFTFYPAVKAYSLGQIQTWVNALFAIGLLLWTRRRTTWALAGAGAAVGAMCLIKPTYGLLVVWGAARRQWAFVAVAGAGIAVAVAASVYRFGVSDHLDYFRVLSFIGRHGEAFYANQSINGLLNRLLFNGSNLEWQYHAFAPFNAIVFAATTASFVALTATALVLPARTAAAGTPLDLSIMAVALTMSAPVAWEHHYGVLLPVFAACAPIVVAARPAGRWTVPLLAASYVVSSQFLPFTNRLAATRLNVVQSYLFAAAALLLWLLCATALRARRG